MIRSWAEKAREDYLYWQRVDTKALRRINALIKNIKRQPFNGLGGPESLKHHWSAYWSRLIDREHRLVNKVTAKTIIAVKCRYHY